MIEALDALNETWGKSGLPLIEIGIGIHRGVARVGNMGSFQRFDYTIMGVAVNLCSRLEGLNKVYGTNILVSGTVYEEVAANDLIFRMFDTVRVKGKSEPVVVYELLGSGEPDMDLVAKLDLHDKAMAAYREGRFSEAIELFSSLKARFTNDEIYALYEGRCLKLKETPPPEWDGITDMTTK
jgi:adenylate cyclase